MSLPYYTAGNYAVSNMTFFAYFPWFYIFSTEFLTGNIEKRQFFDGSIFPWRFNNNLDLDPKLLLLNLPGFSKGLKK